MTETRLWDRAAAVPVPIDGRRFPAVASLPPGDPTVDQLFEFMRDAETRFATLRLRILEWTGTARGDDATQMDVIVRHPGLARVTTSKPEDGVGGAYEVWVSDGDLVRTYASAHRLGTQRPVRNRPRGLADKDFPGASRVYEPITALPMETLPDTFVHPAGYSQNVLATGRCAIVPGAALLDRGTIGLICEHPRTIELVADRPDFRIDLVVDRATGIVLRQAEIDRRRGHPDRRGDRARSRRPAAAQRVRPGLPDRDDDAVLTVGPAPSRRAMRRV